MEKEKGGLEGRELERNEVDEEDQKGFLSFSLLSFSFECCFGLRIYI